MEKVWNVKSRLNVIIKNKNQKATEKY